MGPLRIDYYRGVGVGVVAAAAMFLLLGAPAPGWLPWGLLALWAVVSLGSALVHGAWRGVRVVREIRGRR